MHEVKAKLRELRPSLREVAPTSFFICLGFAILNLVLGRSLTFQPVGDIAIIGTYTPQWLYGLIFFLIGVVGVVALIRNNWVLIRRLQIISVLYKSIWAYALLVGLLQGGGVGIVALWLFITYVQAIVYVFFVPSTYKNGSLGNGR